MTCYRIFSTNGSLLIGQIKCWNISDGLEIISSGSAKYSLLFDGVPLFSTKKSWPIEKSTYWSVSNGSLVFAVIQLVDLNLLPGSVVNPFDNTLTLVAPYVPAASQGASLDLCRRPVHPICLVESSTEKIYGRSSGEVQKLGPGRKRVPYFKNHTCKTCGTKHLKTQIVWFTGVCF